MPHLTIDYTHNLEVACDMGAFCQILAAELVAMRNDENGPLFPVTGTRVLARPAAHFAVADGQQHNGFVYMNLRMAAGRSDSVKKRVGDQLLAKALAVLAPVFSQYSLGLTLHIDDAAPAFDGKHNNLAAPAVFTQVLL